ncbi:hypothetical protein [Allomuricauda sp. M10]|uniref:hypothetical protein n=1 Tax=Allomuricauda sp. M10 TaxID=2683292 RepID=UPI001D18F4D8|nr:hypothetical protein [Muricauda sp. M10]
MEDKIGMEGVLIWLDSNMVHCLITTDFEHQVLDRKTYLALFEKIRVVSKGKNLPLLIHLTDVGSYKAKQLFEFLSPSSYVDCFAPFRIFLVKSFFVKMMMSISCITNGNAFWDTIFYNRKEALEYCQKRAREFELVH